MDTTKERKLDGILDGENVLPDDFPVYGDYIYVADGRVIRSDLFGTVRDLKRDTGAKEIRNCKMGARGLF